MSSSNTMGPVDRTSASTRWSPSDDDLPDENWPTVRLIDYLAVAFLFAALVIGVTL